VQNKAQQRWINDVKAEVAPHFEQTRVLNYLHWHNGKDMDIDAEVERLGGLVEGWDEYAVFAKSAGSLVILKAVREGVIRPSKTVFAGTAVNYGREQGIPVDDLLHHYEVPSTFIQSYGDPAIGYSELADLLRRQGVRDFTVFPVAGSSHDYNANFVGHMIVRAVGR